MARRDENIEPELEEGLALREYQAVLTAKLLQNLIRSRRYHLDDFLDGDGPYWTAIGLFIDEADGVETTAERVVDFVDESIETSRYLLGQMIDHGMVHCHSSADGAPTFRLTPAFSIQFARYLRHQFGNIRATCARIPAGLTPS